MLSRPVTLGLAALLACVTCLAALGTWVVLTPAAAVHAGPRQVDIPASEGLLDISRRLEETGAIRSSGAFVVLATLRGSGRRLKAGEYEIPRDASMLDILRRVEGGKVRQHPVLLPEGGSVAELARTLESAGVTAAAEVMRLAHDPAFLRTLEIEAPTIEGYLFPDTYFLVRGLRGEEILERMVRRMRDKITPAMLRRAGARGLGLHELLTLASIIEREGVVGEERPLIAAVFWNRLRLGMPLQADPTVQYAVGKERRALTRADLNANTPYNTYRRPGLPPGPIASPGLAAIEAALDPASVNYLYFVARDDHRHFFSSTIEQHNAAVARYRLARAR